MLGSGNAFFGFQAGQVNTTGNSNTFIGLDADFNVLNPTGDQNTLLGASTRVTSGIRYATAIGTRVLVTQNNSLIPGTINGVNGCIPAINNCDTVLKTLRCNYLWHLSCPPY